MIMALIQIILGAAGVAGRFAIGQWFAIGPGLRVAAFAVAGGVAAVGGWHLIRSSIEDAAADSAVARRDAEASAESFAINRGFRNDDIRLRDGLRPGDGARRLNGDGRLFLFGGRSPVEFRPCAPAKDASAGAGGHSGG